jgi:hypothetical protein
MIAFTIYDQGGKKALDDPAYVYWVIDLNTYNNLIITKGPHLQPRKCNDNDWAQFYDFNAEDQNSVNY